MKRWRYIKLFLALLLTLTFGISGSSEAVSALETGTISGTVYEVNGSTPIEGIYVSANGGSYSASACTDASGDFTLTDVPLGVPIEVQAAPPWANCGEWKNYVQEFWPESRGPNGANDVVLSAEQPEQDGIDFTLDAGGLISGIVYDADGTTPLPNIAVSIHDEGRTYSQAVCSDANGQYAIHGTPLDLPVYVRTDAYPDNWCNAGADFVSEYWPESPVVGGATSIELTSGDSERTDIDFTVEEGGFVAGTVYAANGMTPLPNTLVFVEGNSSTYDLGACTDQNGNYVIHNLPFNVAFRVKARSNYDPAWCNTGAAYLLEYWPESSDPEGAGTVTLTGLSPSQSDIDFTLTDAGSITGTVFEADGVTPISNIWVVAEGSPDIYLGDCTDASGDFTISALPLDVSLRVQAFPFEVNCGEWKNYAREYWLDKTNSDASDPVILTAETPDRTGINFTLDPGGTISGTVYAADGVTPLAGIFVTAHSTVEFSTNACTDENGHYTISGLRFDVQNRVNASPWWADCGEWKNYVEEYWPEARDQNSADDVVTTAGNPNITGIDFTLEQGGVISGTTYASDGVTPAPHILVSFADETNSYSPGVCSDANGQYEFHGAPLDLPMRARADSYREPWCDSGGEYLPEYWEETPDPASAALITLTELASSKPGIDFTLELAGSISGTVYEADGVTPIPNLQVSVLGGDAWGPSACTDSAGNYTIHNVPFSVPVYAYAQGNITWCGNSNTYTVEFFNNKPGLSGATPLTVSQANAHLTEIDFTLAAIPTPSPDPYLRAWYVDDLVEVDDWPVGTHLTLEIEDPSTPASPDFSTQMDTSEEVDAFELKGLFDVKPGMFVVVSGASITKIVLVDPVTITTVDPVADTISGIASPNSWMWMYFEDSCCRSTVADGTGHWMFDYSVPGAEGEPVADIRPGSDGAVHVPSGDGSTSVSWLVPKPPTVESVVRASPNPTNAATVNYTVTFSEKVTGVNSSDFSITKTGLTDTGVTKVIGSGDTYTVTVKTGSGNGTLRLNVVDNDSIRSEFNLPLGGPGPGNGDFTTGEQFTVARSAPGIPVLLSPAAEELIEDLRPTFDWKDSVPAADHYQLQVATNNSFSSLVVNETVIVGSTYSMTTDLLPGKVYYWRVRGFNVLDLAGGWSIVRAFKTPLAQPVLIAPAMDAVLTTDRPTFEWSAVDGARQYNLQVSASANFGTLLVNATVTGTEYTTPKDLPQNKKLYWRVRAKAPPITGPWSEKPSFTTGNPPNVPVLVAPANNALVKNYRPLFNWNNVTLPKNTFFKYYEIQIDDTNDFSSTILTATTTQDDVTESDFTPLSDLASNTKYYWRVRAVNTINGVDHTSGWSKVFSFRTVIPAPTGLTANPDSLQPTFEWDAATGPGTIKGYTIQVSTNAKFSTLLVNSSGQNAFYEMKKNLPAGKVLYWRVRVNGDNGPSAWTTAQYTTPAP